MLENITSNTVNIQNIIEYIENNVSKKITVKKIAAAFSYSTSYISHMFKKETGTSLQQFLIISKMKYAQKLLNEKNATLCEVASECGYNSVPSFCKIFKKYVGCTPVKRENSDYRPDGR